VNTLENVFYHTLGQIRVAPAFAAPHVAGLTMILGSQTYPSEGHRMLNRKRRDRSLQVECLERRETPSSVTIAHPFVHAAAFIRRAVPFDADVTALLIRMPNSGMDNSFTASAAGRASPLGRFTGALMVSPTNDGGAYVQFNLHGTCCWTMQMTMTVLGKGSDGAPIDIEGTFAITGGTGVAARAIGGGSVSGIVNPQTRSLTLDLQGSFSP
jgi:hypothetical protein